MVRKSVYNATTWILLILVLFDFILCRILPFRVYYVKKIPFGYNAVTFPPFGVFILEREKNNERLLLHEKVHWEQYKGMGFFLFFFCYFFQYFFYGYDLAPMEVEARLKSGEKQACIYNYTDCVKNGEALTVVNENFRE